MEGGFEGKDGFGDDASLEAVPAVSGEILDRFFVGCLWLLCTNGNKIRFFSFWTHELCSLHKIHGSAFHN